MLDQRIHLSCFCAWVGSQICFFLCRHDDLFLIPDFDPLNIGVAELRVEFLGVCPEHLPEFRTGSVLHSGPVFNFFSDVDLTPGNTLFDKKDVKSGSFSVNCRRKPCGTGTDDDQFSFFHCLFSSIQ